MTGHPLARSEGIITEEIGDELVVYDPATQTAHSLSKDAASVWGRCDGHSSAAEIARSVGLDQARVAQALDELSGAALIEEPDGISRRALYKRVAKLGAAAVSAPLIYSIAVPAASAAQSTASACGSTLGNFCQVFWSTPDCSGPPVIDECTAGAGPGCTCQQLGPSCLPSRDMFARDGACGTPPS